MRPNIAETAGQLDQSGQLGIARSSSAELKSGRLLLTLRRRPIPMPVLVVATSGCW
jgi:hypothetical protein